jgi:predicted ATPase
VGTRLRGAALAMLGQVQEGLPQIREGMALELSIGLRCYLPGALCSLAEAQAKAGHAGEGLATLAEALTFVEETGEGYYEAEIHRLRGELLLRRGDAAEAEASFHSAIEVARRQSAKSWELRATTSLCRLWQQQGKHEKARQRLAEIYGWFTEGFDTPDLKEAKTLLEELSA